MKNTRWIILIALIGVIVIGGIWAGLNPPATSSTSAEVEPNTSQTSAVENDTSQSETSSEAAASEATSSETATPTSQPNNRPGVSQFSFGQGSFEVNSIHLQPIVIDEGKADKPLEQWVKDEFPQASQSLIRTWVREKRLTVSNWMPEQRAHNPTVDFIEDPQQISAFNDIVFISVSEFSALRVVMEEFLNDPDRTEYQLFEIEIYPEKKLEMKIDAGNGTTMYVVTKTRYLAVGPLFGGDIDNIPPHERLDSQLRSRLQPWEKSSYVGDFEPYRLYELN